MASKLPSGLFVMVVVVLLAISIAGHVQSTDEGREHEEVKDKTKHVQDKAAETAQESKEASESWAEWAKEKFSEGLGLKHDDDEYSNETDRDASDTAKKTKGKVQEAASGNFLSFLILSFPAIFICMVQYTIGNWPRPSQLPILSTFKKTNQRVVIENVFMK